MEEKYFEELMERVRINNEQIAAERTLENHLHLEVIEKHPLFLLCKNSIGHLSLIMDDKHNVGDIISLLPTGEKAGDGVGVNIVNKSAMN